MGGWVIQFMIRIPIGATTAYFPMSIILDLNLSNSDVNLHFQYYNNLKLYFCSKKTCPDSN